MFVYLELFLGQFPAPILVVSLEDFLGKVLLFSAKLDPARHWKNCTG
jgi:hypothetical protein